ncbi:MAG: LysE family translocator, partial [Planctomycetes bacterium]|nr:LysE family translocator [Planctomycetota bacterium]
MAIEVWLTYTLAAGILLIIPGPTILLVVSYALTEGRRSAVAIVAGVVLGDLTAMTVSIAGLGALLAASATLFTVMKWVGAAYLVYLGVRMWRSSPVLEDAAPEANGRSPWAMLGHSFAVTALNPKGIVFFVAFLPQFVSAQRPVLPQLLILGGTFLVLAFLNAAGYALMAGSVRTLLRRPRTLRNVQRAGGSLLVGAGVLTASL